MSWLRFFRRETSDRDLQQEMDLYLAEEISENLSRGLSPDEARRQAHLKLGGRQKTREVLWQQNSFRLFDNLSRNLKYAVRTLRRSPAFSVVAVVIMALAIGSNIALFAIVRGVLLNPLPFKNPTELFSLYEHESKNADLNPFGIAAAGSYPLWDSAARDLADLSLVSVFSQYNVSAQNGQLPEKIDAGLCTPNLFRILAVSPAAGRFFTADDDRPGANATVVLTYSFWKRRFNADRAIIGKEIWLDANPFTIIGVLPQDFFLSGEYGGNTIQVWAPIHHEASPSLLAAFDNHGFFVIGRLHSGATLEALVSRLTAVQGQIKLDHPVPAVHDSVAARPLLDDMVHGYQTSLYTLFSATGCVLLIACLNVASLLVARTAARRKELAVRVALGGDRLQLLLERVTESFLLSAVGGAIGLFLAYNAVHWLIHVRQDVNRIEFVRFDYGVLLFTLGAILLCALFAGLISAFSAGGQQILTALQDTSRSNTAGRAHAGLRKLLLIFEVSLTVILLIGAGLLLKSFNRLRSSNLGIPVDNTLAMSVSLPGARYKTSAQQAAFFEQLIAKVRAIPGIESAGLVSNAPGRGWGGDYLVTVPEHPPLPKGRGLDLQTRAADPDYFAAVHIPFLSGRTFRADERLEHGKVTILSQSAAQLCFPGEDPIGRHVRDDISGEIFEVIGVVADVRWNVGQPVHPAYYKPIYGNGSTYATVIVRSQHNVESLAIPVQQAIGQMDPDLPVSEVETLRETIVRSTLGSQFDSILILSFAVIALVLAAAGLYGVLAYLVTQRTGEIGIRVALGAQQKQVLRLILFDGLRPALLGLVLGLAASAAVVHLVKTILYETEPLDPAVFVAVSCTLLLVAAVACLIPACRASRLDPMHSLRSE